MFTSLLRTEPLVLSEFSSLMEWDYPIISIETQSSLELKDNSVQRADIVLIHEHGKVRVIIESKIDAVFDSEQIQGYLTSIDEEPRSKVISITRDDPGAISEFDAKKKFIHVYWFQIHHILKKIYKEDNHSTKNKIPAESKFLIREIIKFMEDERMNEFEGFTDSELGIWNSYAAFDSKVRAYLERFKQDIENKEYTLGPLKPGQIYLGYLVKKFEGKLIRKKNSMWIWLGFQLLPAGGDQYRTCCCVQVKCDSKKISDEVKKACGALTNPRNEWYLWKPLVPLIATANQEDHAKILNEFFIDSLKKLENAHVFDIISR